MTHTQWNIHKSCFASNIVFDAAAAVCVACFELADCSVERDRRRPLFLAALDKHHDSKGVSIAQHYEKAPSVRRAPQVKPAAYVAAHHPLFHNETAEKLYHALASRDVDLAAIKKRMNPLAGTRAPSHLKAVVDALLQKPITKADMRERLASTLGVTPVVARKYLEISVGLLGSINVIDPSQDLLEILE